MDGSTPEPHEEEPGEVVDPRAVDLVLRVGELLLASGETTERVNEAMLGLAVAYELPRCEVQVTLTSLLVSAHPGGGAPPMTGTRAIRRRTPAYWRLTALHQLVQDASIGMLELDDAHKRLAQIKRGRPPYPAWLLVVSLGLISASGSVLSGGGPLVATTAFVATLLGDRAAAYLARRGVAEFFQLAVAAAIGATAAVLVVAMGNPGQAATIVTGAILALLPGRPLVASIQDGITGDLVSAGARVLEVFFMIAAIVAGLGAVVYLAVSLGVPIDVRHLPTPSAKLEPVAVIAAAAISLTFAVSLATPRDVLAATALGGALIWVLYVLARGWDVPPVLAAAVAATIVGVAASWLARRHGQPVMPYVVPAIGPLLPGTALYRGMVELNTGSPQAGVLSLITAVSVALALGAGVNLGGELVRAFQRVGLSASGRWARPAARRTRGF
ncbi:threonine/serine ThrE exporter family protein [Actinomadura madurae]|uniref:threonine/serine ThrE exporter family protein n=3 Tax=Actinomadura madurae TaxID=1993 RepID=UPI002027398D|nr:threonine/serine exporter family protein [Actinomadura madurae]MCP9949410.1 threonine/serine exporter family protein [Actinomadura madurae]MCP9966165.1 threonine/serine exporter family protein [Actinomadura madurae]MCQ0009825.1 threonine/serine exporter family protein [Actinomadura madurae]URN05674.1 threonine/serine exporter family protein [Actinomadura madurae]